MPDKSEDELPGVLCCTALQTACAPISAPAFTYIRPLVQPTHQPNPPTRRPISRAKKILSAKRVVTISHAPDIMTPIALTQHIAKKSRLCHQPTPFNPKDQVHQTCVVMTVARGLKSAQERERERESPSLRSRARRRSLARYQLASKSDGRRREERFHRTCLVLCGTGSGSKSKAPHARIFFFTILNTRKLTNV